MNDNLNKKQNRKVTIFAVILSVLSIGLLIFGFTIVSSDKVVMLQSISNLSNKFNKSLDNNSSLINKINSSNDIGINTNLSLSFNDFKASMSINYLENKNDKKSSLSFDTSLNEEDFLNFDLTLNNNLAYIFVDNVTPKYYHTSVEYMSFISSLSVSDYDKLITLLKDAVIDYIDDDEIINKKVEILYNGKNKKVNKLSYKITNKTILDITTNFINSIEKDNTLFENIASCMNVSKDELVVSLDAIIDSINNNQESFEYLYNVYYYGFNKIVQYELEDVNTKEIFTYKIEEKESINLFKEDINYFSLVFSKDKTQYNYNGFILNDDQEKIEFNGSVLDNKFLMVVEQEEYDIKLVVDTNNMEKDNVFTNNTHIVLYSIIDEKENELGILDLNNEYYFDKKVNFNINDSVNINEISDEDLIIIEDNIMNHPIYQIFTSITGLLNFEL